MWDPFAVLIAGDEDLAGVVAEPQPRFSYATGVWSRSLRVIPSISTAADSLKEFLATEAGGFEHLVLIGHSQGGLVIQRCLARMLAEGRGRELARIRRVVLLATPNSGSELLLSVRKTLIRGNPQEAELRPFAEMVADTLRIVLRDIINAPAEPTERSCRIPFSVYAGQQDGLVTRALAQAVFPEAAVLPGDHFTIAKPTSREHRTYATVKRLLLAAEGDRDRPADTLNVLSPTKLDIRNADMVTPSAWRTGVSARRADPARSWIVLVGTSAYTDPDLPDAPVIANNIADLAAVLTDPDLGGFAAEQCLISPPGAGVAQVGELLLQAAAAAEDLLLFYYSGHGLLGRRRRELYLSLTNTRPGQLAFTALLFDAVRDAFLDSRATSRVAILDSCFSGRAIGDTLAYDEVLGQLDVAGTYTLAAAPANRTALFLPGEEHTAFTERLLQLLRTGTPAAGPMLTLGDIYRHLLARLRSEGLPEPQQRGTATADLLGLARNPGHILPNNAPTTPTSSAVVIQPAILPEGPHEGRPQVQVRPETHDDTTTAPSASPTDRNGQRATAALKNAELAATRIAGKGSKSRALAEIARVVTVVDPEWSIQVGAKAEGVAANIEDTRKMALALARVANAVTKSDPERADRIGAKIERLMTKLTDDESKIWALAEAVETLAASDPERAVRLGAEAERVAAYEPINDEKVAALAEVAKVVASIDPDQAKQIGAEAERLAAGITDGWRKAPALAEIVKAVATTDPDRAERLALGIIDDYRKGLVLTENVNAVVATDPERAERLAAGITDRPRKARALIRIVEATAATDPERAVRIGAEAERLAEGITEKNGRTEVLAGIVKSVAVADPERAEVVAAEIDGGYWKTLALIGIVDAVAATDTARAVRLGAEAEYTAADISHMHSKEEALAEVVKAVAMIDPKRADRITEGITDQFLRAKALAGIVEAVAESDPKRAYSVGTKAERVAADIGGTDSKSRALIEIARVMIAIDPEWAGRVAAGITDKNLKAEAQAGIAKAVAANDPELAGRLAADIEDAELKAQMLTEIAGSWLGTG